jgi:hypothetical protein
MQRRPSPNFQNFLFQAELAGMQMARLKRIAKDFDSFVKSAAVNFKIASLGAAPPSSQPGESDSQSMDRGKHDAPARLTPEPLICDQGRRIAEALGTLSSGLSRFPSEDEAIARMRRSILNMEALLSMKH